MVEYYSTTDLNSSITTGTDYTTSSGTLTWTNGSAWLNADGVEYAYGYIPSEIDNIQPIQGNPDGAKWLISWAYKQKDPVCFLKSKTDMLNLLSCLRQDERVIQKSIIIHQISRQFRPKEVRRMKKLWVKEWTLEQEKKKQNVKENKRRKRS